MTDIIYVGLFFLSLILFLIGLAQLLGFGWAMFLFDLFTQSSITDYYHAQKSKGATKSFKGRIIGILLIAAAVIIFILLQE